MKYPEKVSARMLVSNALFSGKILKPDKCSICGETGVIQGHHEDYSKPLEVIWACTLCHAKIHKTKRKLDKLSKIGSI